MAARVTLLVNPFASSVSARAQVVIQRKLAEHFDLTVVETTKRGHAIRLAYGAARSGTDVVIGLGGDGTINEIANGLQGASTPTAPLPGGSTNVFARALGYPNDPIAATDVLIEAIAAESFRSVGVGLADGRAFLFHAGVGFDAAVVERVEARDTLKRYAGHPLYVATTIDTWLRRVDRRRPWFNVYDAEGRDLGQYQLAVALNCRPYTFLGDRPLDLAPEADLDVPLSVVALRSLDLRHIVGAVRQAFRGSSSGSGGIANSATTAHWSGLERITIEGLRPFPFQLDGESCGRVKQVTIDHKPDGLVVAVPPARRAAGRLT